VTCLGKIYNGFFFQNDEMGDLPGEKCKDFQVVKKAKIFQNGEKYEDFSK
jgi:hypothetical protein